MNSTRSAGHIGLVVESDDEYEQLVQPLLDEGARFGDKLIVFGSACRNIAGNVFHHDVPLRTDMLARLRTEVATMLCAYRSGSFDRDAVAAAMSAHPCGDGMKSEDVGFRMWSGDDDNWNVSGVLDLINAGTFRAALASAALTNSRLRLTFVELRFVDLAGVQALADVTEMIPGLSLTVTTPSHSFRRCWRMLGYDETCPRVEIVG